MADKPSQRLDSWKEIAAYLGRDIRTVARWENERGLPVHRVPGGQRHAVFAYTAEIDRWLTTGPGALADGGVPQSVGRGAWMWISAAIIVAALALAVLGFLSVSKKGARLADVVIRGDEMRVLDDTGAVRWTHRFPWPVVELKPEVMARRKHIVDLDGDGEKEVLVVVGAAERSPAQREPEELLCFSASGKLRWSFQFGETLKFGAGEYGPPWVLGDMEMYDVGGEKRIAYAVIHNAWWPSVLLVLDGRGKILSRYVSAGHIYRLNKVMTPSGLVLLAGGVSNPNDGGMLAVLDAQNLSGSSPEKPGSAYECKGCPEGRPLRYFVFPRAELNRVTGAPYNVVNEISVYPDRIEARSRESEWYGPAAIYDFSRDFELKRATFEDMYWDLHRSLELEGKIKHSREQCPERDGPPAIRVWTPEAGWREMRPAGKRP
jgi:hypothetical protein